MNTQFLDTSYPFESLTVTVLSVLESGKSSPRIVWSCLSFNPGTFVIDSATDPSVDFTLTEKVFTRGNTSLQFPHGFGTSLTGVPIDAICLYSG